MCPARCLLDLMPPVNDAQQDTEGSNWSTPVSQPFQGNSGQRDPETGWCDPGPTKSPGQRGWRLLTFWRMTNPFFQLELRNRGTDLSSGSTSRHACEARQLMPPVPRPSSRLPARPTRTNTHSRQAGEGQDSGGSSVRAAQQGPRRTHAAVPENHSESKGNGGHSASGHEHPQTASNAVSEGTGRDLWAATCTSHTPLRARACWDGSISTLTARLAPGDNREGKGRPCSPV